MLFLICFYDEYHSDAVIFLARKLNSLWGAVNVGPCTEDLSVIPFTEPTRAQKSLLLIIAALPKLSSGTYPLETGGDLLGYSILILKFHLNKKSSSSKDYLKKKIVELSLSKSVKILLYYYW